MHFGSREIGYDPCSVNIMKHLYDYYYANITIHDFEFILDNQLENARTARSVLPT